MGIQGSLLSIFVEPIYFSSIILGSLYHGDHLSRAMYQRISNIEDLPALYTLNKPLLSGKYPQSAVSSLSDKLPVQGPGRMNKISQGSCLWRSRSEGGREQGCSRAGRAVR